MSFGVIVCSRLCHYVMRIDYSSTFLSYVCMSGCHDYEAGPVFEHNLRHIVS
jgi:hypothetical protein